MLLFFRNFHFMWTLAVPVGRSGTLSEHQSPFQKPLILLQKSLIVCNSQSRFSRASIPPSGLQQRGVAVGSQWGPVEQRPGRTADEH